MDRPEIILAPGPTPIPPEVLLAQGSPLVYHRGPGFGNLMRDVTTRLKELYRTDSADVLLMTSSGTGGLESAVANCFSPGDEVLVPLAGFFSERFKKLAETYGLTVRTVEYEWGTKIRPDDVAAALAEHPVKAVLLTQSETSTGVIQPIEAAREGRQRRRRPGDRRRGVLARRGALRVRRVGHRRRGRRQPEGPERVARASRSARSASARGRPRAPPRTRASTSTGPPTSGSPTCRTPRTRGRRRSA